MSEREDKMIQRLWDKQFGGTLIYEYPIAAERGTSERRRIDAIILPTRKRIELKGINITPENEPIIVVQAKAHRLGMQLLGQAIFSPDLIWHVAPRSKNIRSIALCGAHDDRLEALIEPSDGIQVVVDPTEGAKPEPSMNTPDWNKVHRFWQQTGGTLIKNYPLADASTTSSRQVAHAVILSNGSGQAPDGSPLPLYGEDVLVVYAREKRFGMYTMGQALFAVRLIEKHYKPKSVRAIILCRDTDSVLAPLLKRFGQIDVVPVP